MIARLVGAALLVIGVVMLVIPNAAHVDVPYVGRDIFFDCGGTLYPGSRPAEEPDITACAEINSSMLQRGLLLGLAGAATLLVVQLRRPTSEPTGPLY